MSGTEPLNSVATHTVMVHIADGEMPEFSVSKLGNSHTIDIEYHGGRIVLFVHESFGLDEILKALSKPRVVS